eukprot:scaffold236205_cov32-Tisochrysis_lutea.AAC.2
MGRRTSPSQFGATHHQMSLRRLQARRPALRGTPYRGPHSAAARPGPPQHPRSVFPCTTA